MSSDAKFSIAEVLLGDVTIIFEGKVFPPSFGDEHTLPEPSLVEVTGCYAPEGTFGYEVLAEQLFLEDQEFEQLVRNELIENAGYGRWKGEMR